MGRSWYQQDWAIIALLVFFFPAGLYLMWRYASWSPQIKWVISGAIALIGVVAIISSAVSGGSDDDAESARAVAQVTSTPGVDNAGETSTPPLDGVTPTKPPATIAAQFSVLEISEVNVSGGNVTISGRTDLPDGAVVSVTFDVWGRADADLYIGVGERTTVSGGEFSVMLAVPQRDEFVNGPYEVSVLFTPRGQDDSVLALIGDDGEKLTGELVEEFFEFKLLRLEQRMDLDVAVSPPSYVFRQASDFPAGSAEQTLANWVAAWRDEDWQRMANLSQLTWADVEPDPVGILDAWYGFKTLKGFEVKDIDRISEVATDVTFVVQYEAFTNQIDKKEITAKVIRETAPYEPSAQGEWGVNPISALAETDLN